MSNNLDLVFTRNITNTLPGYAGVSVLPGRCDDQWQSFFQIEWQKWAIPDPLMIDNPDKYITSFALHPGVRQKIDKGHHYV